MTYDDILYDVQDGICTIKFNRPQAMNAGTVQTYSELEDAFRSAADDANVRVVVLTGEGRAFCAGDDIKSIFLTQPDDSAEARQKRLLAEIRALGKHRRGGLDDAIIKCPKRTIAAINGAAVGYGCYIAWMCDVRIASDRAAKPFLQDTNHEEAR